MEIGSLKASPNSVQTGSSSSISNTPGKTPLGLPEPGSEQESMFRTQYEVEEVEDKEQVPVQR